MDHRLIAQLFGSSAQKSTAAAEKVTSLNYQDIIVDIFLRFLYVLEGVVIIIAGLIVVRYLKRYFIKAESVYERQKTALNLLEKITNGFIVVISITLGLKVIGLDITLIVGVLTLGLSFGMRDVIKNYVAGLLILFKAPFEIGDTVKIRAFTGKIEKIEFQAITLRTFDNKTVTIHNSDILTQPITNFSKTQMVRLEIDIGLGYGTDVQRAVTIFDRIVQNTPAILKTPKYSVVFNKFSENSMHVKIRFWVNKPCNVLAIRSGLALQIQEAFDEENLFSPYIKQSDLEGSHGMTEGRKVRLKNFYDQPLLADIAAQTFSQVAVAAVAVNGNGAAPAPAEEYADVEEPE